MTNNIIGERIAGLLREQGKTQSELAEQVDTTRASICRYIKGDRVPKGPVLAKIAKALYTTTDYLLGDEPEQKSKLSKREKEIRNYLLEEHAQEFYLMKNHTVSYTQGREEASREILEKVLDILGG